MTKLMLLAIPMMLMLACATGPYDDHDAPGEVRTFADKMIRIYENDPDAFKRDHVGRRITLSGKVSYTSPYDAGQVEIDDGEAYPFAWHNDVRCTFSDPNTLLDMTSNKAITVEGTIHSIKSQGLIDGKRVVLSHCEVIKG